jgi:hypothetical protein
MNRNIGAKFLKSVKSTARGLNESSKGRKKVNEEYEGTSDPSAAQELELFIDNDGDLYRQQIQPIYKNLLRKMVKGKYDHELAKKLWMYLVDNGAKKYVKEFGGDVRTMFPKPLRQAVASVLADDFRTEVKAGGISPEDYDVKGEVDKSVLGESRRRRHTSGKSWKEISESITKRHTKRRISEENRFDRSADVKEDPERLFGSTSIVGVNAYEMGEVNLNGPDVIVGIMHDSSGYTPSSYVSISQPEPGEAHFINPDTVLQDAYDGLLDFTMEHYSDGAEKDAEEYDMDVTEYLSEGFDGFYVIVSPQELKAAIDQCPNQYNKETLESGISFSAGEEDYEESKRRRRGRKVNEMLNKGHPRLTGDHPEVAYSVIGPDINSGGVRTMVLYFDEDKKYLGWSDMMDDTRMPNMRPADGSEIGITDLQLNFPERESSYEG